MTALEKLRAEPTPFAELSVEEWERALLAVATKQVTTHDVGEGVVREHSMSLTGVLWFLLLAERKPSQAVSGKHLEMGRLVRQAIEDLGDVAFQK